MNRNYTQRQNVVVAATGKLRHEEILDLVQRHFGDLPAQPALRALTDAKPMQRRGSSVRSATWIKCTWSWASHPSVTATPDYYPTICCMSTLLGGGMSSRLFQEIREKRGLVYSIYSFAAPFKDGGLFGIYAGTGESEAAELMPVMLAELGNVQSHITQPELGRARAQLKASLLMSQESTGSRCEQLSRQIQTFGRVIPIQEVLGKINAVTTEDIRRAAARHFRAVPTLATIGPAEHVPELAAIVGTLAA